MSTRRHSKQMARPNGKTITSWAGEGDRVHKRTLHLEKVKFRAAPKCYIISYLPHDTRHIIQIPKNRLALLVMQILNAGGIEGDAGRTDGGDATDSNPPEQVKIEGTVRKAAATAALLRPCTEGRGGGEGAHANY